MPDEIGAMVRCVLADGESTGAIPVRSYRGAPARAIFHRTAALQPNHRPHQVAGGQIGFPTVPLVNRDVPGSGPLIACTREEKC